MTRKIIVSIFALVFSLSAFAHHGWRSYALDYDFTATVTSVTFRMPHAYIVAVDEQGKEWNLFLAPADRNRKFGYDEDSIPTGVPLQLIGQHAANDNEGKVHFANSLEGENYYTYYYDNGTRSWDRR
jgi:hypothetical protein